MGEKFDDILRKRITKTAATSRKNLNDNDDEPSKRSVQPKGGENRTGC